MRRRAVIVVTVLVGLAAVAGITRASLGDDAQSLEARTQAVASTLRCPTCDNLSVADSPEAMASSMRDEIRTQLQRGRSPDEVRQWFVDRYGAWVRLSPPGEGVGLLVWTLPAGAVAVGLVVAVWLLRGRRAPAGSRSPTDVDRRWAEWRRGELTLPDTPEGERAEAAFDWLAHERDSAATAPRRRAAAAEEAAAAWQALQQAPAETGRGWRPLGWGLGAVVVIAAVAAALPTAIAARGIGGVATGTVPGADGDRVDDQAVAADAQPSPGSAPAATTDELLAEIEAVAAAEADPADAATAVRGLLPPVLSADQYPSVAFAALQQDHLAAAEALSAAVLADDPEDLEATLIRGLALAARGDDAGAEWLRTFLAAAPADHPGRPVAAAAANEPGEAGS